jgi:hypothetical protein
MSKSDAAPLSEHRWATVVRVLALLATVLLVIAVLEARTIRLAKAELQRLRDDARQHAAAREVVGPEELGIALRRLDLLYGRPGGELGLPGGLCSGGRLDDAAISAFVGGAFLPARLAGRPIDEALAAMDSAVLASGLRGDAGRARQPAPPTR